MKTELRFRSNCKCVNTKTFERRCCTKSKAETIKKKERRKQVTAGTGSQPGVGGWA